MADLSATIPPAAPQPLAPSGPVSPDTAISRARPSSLWRDTIGNILRQRSAVVGLVILLLLVFMAVFAPLIATHDPNQVLLGVEPGVE